MSAGELRNAIAFESQESEDGDYGTIGGSWCEQFTRSARIRYLRGSEPVLAQRLVGVQPAVITVRSDSETRCVTSSWRLRDARTGTLFNIRSVTPDEKRQYIDYLVDAGVAV